MSLLSAPTRPAEAARRQLGVLESRARLCSIDKAYDPLTRLNQAIDWALLPLRHSRCV